MKQVTLQPGDYVATKGMTEEQYHEVAWAFMNAGANEGEYPDIAFFEHYAAIGWSTLYDAVWHQRIKHFERMPGCQLTIHQVLNATNAGKETDMHITDKLNRARDEHDKAQARYEQALAEHRAAYPWLIIDERGEQPTEDMTDPANWRVGDIVLCVSPEGTDQPRYFTEGRQYKIDKVDGSSAYKYIDDDGDRVWAYNDGFRFHSRP